MDVMPFGKHEGKPLGEVPSDYLCWAVRECDSLSGGMRLSIAEELRRRGVEPPQRRPKQEPKCADHEADGFTCRWQTDSLGRRHIKAECAACGRHLGFLPIDVPDYREMADLNPASK